MQNSLPTRFANVRAMAALISILLIAPAFAQETADAEEAVSTPETDSSNEPTAEQSGAPNVVDSGAALDYEPTESISEDLSVSFPVDI